MGSDSKHVVIELGVWTVVLNKSTPFFTTLKSVYSAIGVLWSIFWNTITVTGPLEDDKNLAYIGPASSLRKPSLMYFIRFVKDIYLLGPRHFYVGIFLSGWEMASGALKLYSTTLILRSVSLCLDTRQLQPLSIALPILGRVSLSIISEYLTRIGREHSVVLEQRVKYHFLRKTMQKALNLDLSTTADPEVRDKLEESTYPLDSYAFGAWSAFDDIKETVTGLLGIIFELALVFSFSHINVISLLSLTFCFVDPTLNILRGGLYAQSFVAFCNNSHFSRMMSIHNLAFNEEFREDRITNNLGPYIAKEFDHNRRLLGETRTDHVYSQWRCRMRPFYSSVSRDMSWDFSLIIFALRVLWDHKSVAIEELFVVQEASKSIQFSLYRILYNLAQLSRRATTIKNLYSIEDIQNKVKDGENEYPAPSLKNRIGAGIEFRNVSFQYPGTNKNAITELSFTIKPGQLVAIVGLNGSGKSSTIKLLARLYDPSTGEILLDGEPLSSYKLADVRSAMAVLRQDHPVLPVSLRENIAFGLPDRSATDEEIEEAIRLGGAENFVKKLKQGSETVLNPVKATTTNFVDGTDADLKAVIDDKDQKTDLSGGESQRLSASRTFMRLMGGNIRLLVADEPTSALDPAGEYELFSRLREHRHGKTVIFITHRFGHLTKYADVVLCLKDGRLVEQGTHGALMATNGEYKRLYDIQARAFVSA